MKKALITVCVVVGLVSIPFFTHIQMKKFGAEIHPLANSYKPISGSTEKLYHDIFLSLLEPYTERAIDDFYSKYLSYVPGSAPYFEEVLNVQRMGNKPSTFDFLIKLEVKPYIGPHNSVGVDHITFRVRASGEVTLEKFEHIKSYDIAPNYQHIIKKWPPQ